MKTDWKPPRRIIEDREGWEALRRAKLGPCRICGETWLPQLHHLVPRGQGGDDVPDNLVPLCREHHQAVTEWVLPARVMLRSRVTTAELAYVDQKMGMGWFDFAYPDGFVCRNPETEWIRDLEKEKQE